ncbi:MAG: T9SS type A sorting domain-containing protein [Bacteroidota bacterium]
MKTIVTFLALFTLHFGFVQAQGWERLISVDERDHPTDIAPTPDGGSIIVGWSRENNAAVGTSRIPFAKVDAQGHLEWSRIIDPMPGIDEASSVLSTPDGGYLIGGTTSPAWDNNRKWLMKTDAQGVEEWQRTYHNYDEEVINDIVATPDGNYVALGTHADEQHPSIRRIDISKFSPTGDLLWRFDYGDSTSFAEDIEVMDDGHLIIAGMATSNFAGRSRDPLLLKINSDNGTLIWEKKRITLKDEDSPLFSTTIDGGLIVCIPTALSTTSVLYELIKFDSEGNEEWIKQYTYNNNFINDLDQASNGDYVAVGAYGADFNLGELPGGLLIRFDPLGNERWRKRYPYSPDRSTTLNTLYEQPDGGLILLGGADSVISVPLGIAIRDIYLVRTDSLGIIYNNAISGNVFADSNADCLRQPSEPGLPNWIISLEGNSPQVTTTDSLGNYHFDVDTGQYIVKLSPFSAYWTTCLSEQSINLSNFADTATADFAATAIIDCPLLTVDVDVPFLRRCFPNTYYVKYCNRGTLTANTPYIEIEFDEFLSVDSATLPFTNNGQLYRFELDSLPASGCGDFRVYTQLDCDSTVLGQTHCVEAHIYPDSICQPTVNWSGASVEVDAVCEGDSVRLNIRNVGTGNMQMALPYIVIEDEVILRSDNFLLPVDSVLSITEPADGSTFRLEAEQEPNHPGNSQPSVTLEGCGGWPFALGFVSQFPQNDGNPFVDINCTASVGAYDPNDKQGFPLGYDNQNYIKANQDIEYLIRFQNTGTDTAFRVVIRDTIASTLDITSIRPATASHPYSFQLYGDNIVQFTFDDIMLPDSFVNEPASNGFVKFHIAQQPDLPDGTVIENSAAIYFDFNEPIITNVSWHTIGENFVLVNTSPKPEQAPLRISAFPNPFSTETHFEFEGLVDERGPRWFELYDLQGRRLRQQAFDGSRFTFQRGGLPAGVYPYVFRSSAKVLGTGKLIIQ